MLCFLSPKDTHGDHFLPEEKERLILFSTAEYSLQGCARIHLTRLLLVDI